MERFEIWSDPDVGDWTVTEHFENGSEEVIADCLADRAEAERYVANLLFVERVDAS